MEEEGVEEAEEPEEEAADEGVEVYDNAAE